MTFFPLVCHYFRINQFFHIILRGAIINIKMYTTSINKCLGVNNIKKPCNRKLF